MAAVLFLNMNHLLLVLSVSLVVHPVRAQQARSPHALVYVDDEGVLRYTKGHAEASFFGVNYTAPFAYSYRAHKALGVDIEQAIREDVYHLARLGLDAFRVHVWDTEISDSLGNLLANDHLRLFDLLIAELEKRKIRVIITPIAFWGNGYPERDERTPGFSRVFGKGRATSNDTAIRAQENYLHQLFTHVNSYTGLAYPDDPDIIAVELNNEPSHSGPKSGVTAYINRLATAVRSVGWTKPLFYNISQSPYYADAVAASEVNGFSFQWYPSGLVAGYEQKGNFLPNVDSYPIPYDTIPAFRKKARMVYEFESADILQSYMYPAMARSFREAGCQWATQFAYDPLALAYANTEYQTHYLNLAYTPSKAISTLIASRVFHEVRRSAHLGVYPADSVFGPFRVSYRASLSEMNSGPEFYYSRSTDSKPVDVVKLQHLAGVGNSPVVEYRGYGAYFLDKVGAGLWRLEVMPDAISIRDPFERAAPDKEVTRIQWERQAMTIRLPDLGEGFGIKGWNAGNDYQAVAAGTQFSISPGTYLLSSEGSKGKSPAADSMGVLGMHEFFAPKPFSSAPFVVHEPYKELSPGKPFIIRAKIVGIDSTDQVTVQVNRLGGGFGSYLVAPMTRESAYDYSAEVPVRLVQPGVLLYRIIIRKNGGEWFAFPGNHRGDPAAWDYINKDDWQTYVAGESAGLEIFNPAIDRNINVYPSFRRGFQNALVGGPEPGRLVLRMAEPSLSDDHVFGFQCFFADKLKGRATETFNGLFIRARTTESGPVRAKITLTNRDGVSFSGYVTLQPDFADIELPLADLFPDSSLLLPRPYPGFLPLWFKAPAGSSVFSLSEAERIQVTLGTDVPAADRSKPYSMEIASIWMRKAR